MEVIKISKVSHHVIYIYQNLDGMIQFRIENLHIWRIQSLE